MSYLYKVCVYDASIASKPELTEVAWHGDDKEKGEDAFEDECERVRRLVTKAIVEPGTTRVTLEEWDGTEERRILI